MIRSEWDHYVYILWDVTHQKNIHFLELDLIICGTNLCTELWAKRILKWNLNFIAKKNPLLKMFVIYLCGEINTI